MSDTSTVQPGRSRDGRRRNNLSHGIRAASLGTTPKGASYIGRLVAKLRRELEAAVIDASGEISLQDALTVNTACRWERHAMLANRWLAKNSEKMTFDQRLAFSRDIARASENRDRAVQRLNLSRDASSVIDALYSAQITEVEDPNPENH